jgi:HNH endonuclease/AP2 domain
LHGWKRIITELSTLPGWEFFMKKILLGGKYNDFALVDDEDYKWISQWHWYTNNTKRVLRHYRIGKRNEGKYKIIHLSRVIMNAPEDKLVDHINGNSFDNRKENLRLCTKAENSRNKKASKSNTSGYKGVSWSKQRERWESCIKINYKKKFLGYFNTAKEAAIAYNIAAKKYYGEFARFNVIL